jgi:hypothetical protein
MIDVVKILFISRSLVMLDNVVSPLALDNLRLNAASPAICGPAPAT